MPIDYLLTGSLIFLLLAAAVSDLRWHRIPNLISLGGIAIAFALQIAGNGTQGALFALIGMTTGFALFVVPYAVSVMGAGDVKLAMMVGAFLGWYVTLQASLFAYILGGVMAVLVLASRGGLGDLVKRYGTMLFATAAGQPTYLAPQDGDAARTRFPYALAIALGAVIAAHRNGFLL
jgi:prepilin peptidase CpaA